MKNMGNQKKGDPVIAMIGCGAISEIFYLPALQKFPSIMKNMILIDPSIERLNQLANDFSIEQTYLSHKHLLDDGIDAVIVTAPNQFHHSIAVEFLKRRIPVLCEKPLSITSDNAKNMVNVAHDNNVLLLTNYQRRLYASYQKVEELIKSRALGEPLELSYSEGQKYSWPIVSGSRFDTKISNRGVLLDRGAHVLDTVYWWLGGKPKTKESQNDSFGGCEAVAHVDFEYENCKGQIKLSLLGNLPCVYQIKCERGIIEGDIYDFRNLWIKENGQEKKLIKLKTKEKSYTDFGMTIVSNFINVLKGKEEPLITGSDVLESIGWIDECYEKASRLTMPWYENLEI